MACFGKILRLLFVFAWTLSSELSRNFDPFSLYCSCCSARLLDRTSSLSPRIVRMLVAFARRQGLLLGGGRVLHKLKEEFGGTLEYRRSQGVVCVYGQRGSTRKAAACVRSAMLLRDGRGEQRVSTQHAEETSSYGAFFFLVASHPFLVRFAESQRVDPVSRPARCPVTPCLFVGLLP